MRLAKVSAEEQYRLIMECRRSGLSDQQWCLNHDIKPGTFYNWVSRLRQKGGADIPAPAGRPCEDAPKQEVVRLQFNEKPSSVMEESVALYEPSFSSQPSPLPAIELSIGIANLRIPNGIDPILLVQMLRSLKEFVC